MLEKYAYRYRLRFARNKPIYVLESINDLALMSLIKAVISPSQLIKILKEK